MRKFTPLVILGLVLTLLFFTVFGNHGYSQLQKIDHDVRAMQGKNRSLQSEIAKVRSTIYTAKHSPAFLERKAREELGLSRKGEVVYIFPTNQAQ